MRELPQLAMEHERLDQVEAPTVGPGYSMRRIETGDMAELAALYKACDLGLETEEEVRSGFAEIVATNPQRVIIIEHEGRVVGSGMFAPDEADPSFSVMHLIAVLPEHRKKKLGVAICQYVLRGAHEDGFMRQRLTTDDDRLAAIALYLGLGFRPLYSDASHPPRWRRVLSRLELDGGRPRPIYEGGESDHGDWSLGQRIIDECRTFASHWRDRLRVAMGGAPKKRRRVSSFPSQTPVPSKPSKD